MDRTLLAELSRQWYFVVDQLGCCKANFTLEPGGVGSDVTRLGIDYLFLSPRLLLGWLWRYIWQVQARLNPANGVVWARDTAPTWRDCQKEWGAFISSVSGRRRASRNPFLRLFATHGCQIRFGCTSTWRVWPLCVHDWTRCDHVGWCRLQRGCWRINAV